MGPNALTVLIEGRGAESAPAVLSREHGAWSQSTARFADQVRGLAAALHAYGLGAGVRAAVLGSEGAGTLGAGLAVISAGATLVPLDPALSDDALRRALLSTGAVHAIASNERQLARVLALRPELPSLDLVLLMSAVPSERKPAAMLVDAAIEVGLGTLASDPEILKRAAVEGESGPACLLVDKAGETRSVPRAALLGLSKKIGGALGLGPGTTVLAALPVGGAERLGAALAALGQGATLLLPDDDERLDAGLDQHPADIVLLDVAGMERLFRAWVKDIDARSWLGRRLTRWAIRTGGAQDNPGWKHRIADSLALRGLRGKLGGRAAALDVVVAGGTSAETEASAFFSAIGLSLRYFSPGVGDALAR